LCFTSDDSLLITGSSDDTLRTWSTDALALRPTRSSRGSVSPDQRLLLHRQGPMRAAKEVVLSGFHTGEEIARLRPRRDANIYACGFSPDGRFVVAATSDESTVRVWSTVTGEHLATLGGHRYHVEQFAFSRNGKRLATGSEDYTFRVWSLPTGRLQFAVPAHDGTVSGITFSPDGALVSTASWSDPIVRHWDATTGAVAGTLGDDAGDLGGHTDGVHSVAYSPDGSLIATGSADTTVRLWDPASARCTAVLRGHAGRVSRVCFSHDPHALRLASLSEDGAVKIWDPSTQDLLLTLRAGRVFKNVEFSPDDVHLVVDGVVLFSCVASDVLLASRDSYRNAELTAVPVVERLFARQSDWRQVTSRLRADDQLATLERHAALDHVLRRSSEAREQIRDLGEQAAAALRDGEMAQMRASCDALLELGRRAPSALDVALPQTLLELADLLHEREFLDDAEALFRKSLLVTSVDRDVPSWGDARRDAVRGLDRVAEALDEGGRRDEAHALWAEITGLLRERPDLELIGARGDALRGAGRDSEADEWWRLALELLPAADDAHASTLRRLAWFLQDAGWLEEADIVLERALATGDRVLANDLWIRRALLAEKAGRLEDAEQHFRRAHDLGSSIYGSAHPKTAEALHHIAWFLKDRGPGRLAEAEDAARDALDIIDAARGSMHRDTLNARETLAFILRLQGELERSRTFYVELEETVREQLGEEDWLYAAVRAGLGRCLLDMGRCEDARSLMIAGYEGLMKDSMVTPRANRVWIHDFIRLYECLEEPEQVEKYRQKLEELGAESAPR
ncbi:MAG: tetratricopeptide repeat protein, partial [Planctomycetota bacterium]